MELFAEHGFDKVPVAEIARRAEVSEATVFNYFATKEDIFYQGMHAFEQAIVDAVRDRPPGTSIAAAALAGGGGGSIADDVLARGREALELLEGGLSPLGA